jgi:hypothetical protein
MSVDPGKGWLGCPEGAGGGMLVVMICGATIGVVSDRPGVAFDSELPEACRDWLADEVGVEGVAPPANWIDEDTLDTAILFSDDDSEDDVLPIDTQV